MTELAIHDPFQIPHPDELENEVYRPRWWYAQQMRIAGASWREIAEALGYKDQNSAQGAVKNARRDRSQDKETLEDIVDLELERLDMLQLICWRTAQQGDLKAVQTILAIMQLRMRFLGTEKKPNESSGTTNNTAIFIGGNEAEYTEALRRVRERNKYVIETTTGDGSDGQVHDTPGGQSVDPEKRDR